MENTVRNMKNAFTLTCNRDAAVLSHFRKNFNFRIGGLGGESYKKSGV